MSSETQNLNLTIDASGAQKGADQFASVIDKVQKAVVNLDKQMTASFARINANMQSFGQMAKHLTTLSNLNIKPGTAKEIQNIAVALSALAKEMPSASSVNNLHAFANALNHIGNINPRTTTMLSALRGALFNFRAPSAQQISNYQSFVAAVNNTSITANAPRIVLALNSIAAAAQSARAALSGVGGGGINLPPGLRGSNWANQPPQRRGWFGGAAGGGGNRGYGPRSGWSPGPYDGIFSGTHRATGELRGMENMVNPGFQAASILRAMIPAVTAGEGLKGLYEAGVALVSFQHTLESATNVAGDFQGSLLRLHDSMQFATDTSMKYGLNLRTVQEQWGRFAVTAHTAGFSSEDSKKMFDNISQAVRARGLDPEQIQRVFNAFDQAMSTGRWSMMQMHRELGLLMPAPEMMAKALTEALGHTVTPQQMTDMSRKGQIGAGASPFLAAQMQATYAPGLETAINSPQSSLERLKTQLELFKREINSGGAWEAMGDQFKRLADILARPEFTEIAQKLGHGLADALRMMGDGAEWAANHVDLLTKLFKMLLALSVVEAVGRTTMAFAGVASVLGTAATGIRVATGAGTAMLETLGAIGSVVPGLSLMFADLAAVIGGIGVVVAAAATAVVAAVAAIGAIFVIGQEKVISFGETSETVAQWVENRWDEVKEHFAPVWDSIAATCASAFAEMKATVGDWAVVVIGWLATIMDRLKQAGEFLSALRDNSTYILTTPLIQFDSSKLKSFAPTTRSGDTAAQWAAADAARNTARQRVVDGAANARAADAVNARRDRRETADATWLAAYDPNYKPPPVLNPGTEKKGRGGGKSDAEKAQDHLDSVLKGLDPMAAQIEQFTEKMEAINKAEALNVHSKGALWLASTMPKGEGDAYLKGEYARARQELQQSMLEHLGVTTPLERATNQLAKAQAAVNAEVQIGIATQGKFGMTAEDAKQRIDRMRESLQSSLKPFDEWLSKLREENAELLLGNKAREEAQKLRQLDKELKDKRGFGLTDEERAAAKVEVELNQQRQRQAQEQNAGLQVWANSFGSFENEIAKVEQKIPDMLADVWTKFVMTGKFSIKEVANQLEADLLKATSKELFRSALQGLGITGEPGSDPGGGSLLGRLFGGTKPITAGGAGGGSAGGVGGWLSSLWDRITGKSGAAGANGAVGPNGPQGASGAGGATERGLSAIHVTGNVSVYAQGGVKSPFGGGGGGGSPYDWMPSNLDTSGEKLGAPDANGWQTVLGSGGSSNATGSSGFMDSLFGKNGFFGGGLGFDASTLLSIGGAVMGMTQGKTTQDKLLGFAPLAMKLAGTLFGSGGALGGAGAGIGSFFSGLFSEGGYSTSPATRSLVSAMAFAGAPHYAEGTANTSGGIPAYLHPDEAVIPLSRGRKIPVDMGKAGGGNNVHVTMNVTATDADSFARSQGQIESRIASSLQRTMHRNG